MDARSARVWSSEAAARAICPNSLRRRCCISEETGGCSVCGRTDTLVTCAVYGTSNQILHGDQNCVCVCDANADARSVCGRQAC